MALTLLRRIKRYKEKKTCVAASELYKINCGVSVRYAASLQKGRRGASSGD